MRMFFYNIHLYFCSPSYSTLLKSYCCVMHEHFKMLSFGRYSRNKLQKSLCSTDSSSAACFKEDMIHNIQSHVSNILQTTVVKVRSIILWICHFKVEISNSPYKAFVNIGRKMISNMMEGMKN